MDLERAEKITVDLIKLHNVSDWQLGWMDIDGVLGMTDFENHVLSLNAPSISVNDEDILVEVVLHEIAHVKVGPNVGHGDEWKAMAYALGAEISVPLGAMPPGAAKSPTPWRRVSVDNMLRIAPMAM